MTKRIKLENEISKILLDLVIDSQTENWLEEMTTSDMQGVVQAKAMEIVRLCNE